MKDRQAPQTQAQARIPVLSPVLHCVSMTVIVFLRSGFGYAYLRPKSIFFALSWAFLLFTVYSWMEPGRWAVSAALCLYGLGAILLYSAHIAKAFASELRGSATHDHDSGIPHLLRFLRPDSPEQFRMKWVLWGEPAAVLLAAILSRLLLGAKNHSAWLLLCAVSLWLKEALNFWLQIRQRKRHRDAMEDAEDGFDGSHVQFEVSPPAPSRRAKVPRKRTH